MRGPCHLVVVIAALLGGCTDGPSVTPPGTDDTIEESDTTGGGALEVRYGDIVITEFLVSSLQCPGQAGQYVEIENRGRSTIDLGVLQIGNGTNSIAISAGSIAPGVTLVGGPESGAGCRAVSLGFTYPDLLLSYEAGRVEVWWDAVLIDSVDFHT